MNHVTLLCLLVTNKVKNPAKWPFIQKSDVRLDKPKSAEPPQC